MTEFVVRTKLAPYRYLREVREYPDYCDTSVGEGIERAVRMTRSEAEDAYYKGKFDQMAWAILSYEEAEGEARLDALLRMSLAGLDRQEHVNDPSNRKALREN